MWLSPWRRIVDSRATPVVLLAFFAVVARVFIGRMSTWFDESYQLLLVGPHSMTEIARRTAVDGHPPLAYWILKPWVSVFGSNIVAARAESALFMTAALAVWYHFLRTRFGRSLALLALLFMVVNPSIQHFAIEARMYAFGILLVATSCVLLTPARRTTAHWVGYWIVAVAMMYTHYFLAFVIAGQFLWLFLRRREQGVRLWWLLVFGVSIIAGFAPWIPFAAHQTSGIVSNGFWIPPVSPNTLPDYVVATFLNSSNGELESLRVWPALAFFFAIGAALIAATKSKLRLGLLWSVAFVPWLFLFALSTKPLVPVFFPRYVLFSLFALSTLVAAGALSLEPRRRAVAIAVLMFGMLWGDCSIYLHGFDIGHHHAMREVKSIVHKPIDGAFPPVITLTQFEFFDVRATIPMDQQVVISRAAVPQYDSTDAIYYDKPDWYVTNLSQVRGPHAWLVEYASNAPLALPVGWTEEHRYTKRDMRIRLIRIAPSLPAVPIQPLSSGPARP